MHDTGQKAVFRFFCGKDEKCIYMLGMCTNDYDTPEEQSMDNRPTAHRIRQ